MILNNYNIYNIDKVNDKRTKKVASILNKDVPDYVKNDFSKLCDKFSDIFALEEDTMTGNNFYKQHIRLTDDEPVFIRQYRLPHTQKQEIDRQVNTFLKNGLFEPSMSNYNSPVIIIPKNTKGKWSMCFDYRMINKQIVSDHFPLPHIDDTLDSLGRARYFSVLDLFQ